MQPLKILHIATHTGVYRGGAVQACRMAEGLVRRGHEVTLLAAVNPKASAEVRAKHAETWTPLKSKGVEVATLHYGGLFGHRKLRQFIDEGGYDVVHAHRDDALLAARRALAKREGPVLVAQRGTISPPPEPVAAAFESPRVVAVVAVAKAVRQSLLEHTSADPEKVHVVYGSVDLEKFAPRERNVGALQSVGFPEDAYIVGSLSAFRKTKGFVELMKALNRAMKEAPEMRALFLGSKVDVSVKPRTRKVAEPGNFKFLGHQADVPSWLSAMDVTVVAASDREGLSGVLRESLAMGVPVISTDCAGNREIVRDRETGLLVPIDNVDALCDALLWAHAHPEAMKAMAERGRAWVQRQCTIEKQSESLEGIYASVLEGRTARQHVPTT